MAALHSVAVRRSSGNHISGHSNHCSTANFEDIFAESTFILTPAIAVFSQEDSKAEESKSSEHSLVSEGLPHLQVGYLFTPFYTMIM